MRLRVLESPAFRQVRTQNAVVKLPLVRVLRDQRRDVLKAMFVRAAEQSPFHIFTTFVLTYGTKELDVPRGQVLGCLMAAAALGLLSMPFFGWLSDVVGR